MQLSWTRMRCRSALLVGIVASAWAAPRSTVHLRGHPDQVRSDQSLLEELHALTGKLEREQRHNADLTHELSSVEIAKRGDDKRIAVLSSQLQKLEASAKEDATVQRLERKLNNTVRESTQVEGHLRSEVNATVGQLRAVQAELQRVQLDRSALLRNITVLQQRVDGLSKMARHERLMLLNQVSELQEGARATEQQKSSVEQHLKAQLVEEEQHNAFLAARLAEHDRESRRQLDEARRLAAAANASSAETRAQLADAKKQGVALARSLESRQEELHDALLEGNELRGAKEQTEQDLAKERQHTADTKAALEQEEYALKVAQQQLEAAKSANGELSRKVEVLQQQSDKLRAEGEQLRNQTAQQRAASAAQLHAFMLSAASKVHDMEEHVDSLQDQLAQAQRALSAETADDNKAKDTLMQETQSALEATREAATLNATLAEVQEKLRLRDSKIAALSARAASLEVDGRRATSSLLDVSRANARWQAQLESLQETAKEATSQAKEYKSENAALRTQLANLGQASQQAEALSGELSDLRAAAAANQSRELQMVQQMKRLRELKDHYSSELEAEDQEVATWKQKAQEDEARLADEDRSVAVVTRQRDVAQDRIRAARSEVDEYFEENTRLQQQSDGLQAKLEDAGRAANRTALQMAGLRHEIQELHADVVREQQAARTAWVSNQRALAQAQEQTRAEQHKEEALKADLAHTQATLLDWQRRALGLPPLPKVPPKVATTNHTATASRPAPVAKMAAKPIAVHHSGPAQPAASTLQKLAAYFSSSPFRT